jgi:hypothetical protein
VKRTSYSTPAGCTVCIPGKTEVRIYDYADKAVPMLPAQGRGGSMLSTMGERGDSNLRHLNTNLLASESTVRGKI